MRIEEKQVAQLELFPYQTSSSKDIPKKFVNSSDKANFLASQRINFKMFKYFLTDTDAIFVVRDWNRWNDLIENYLYENDLSAIKENAEKFKKRSFVPNYPRSFYLATDKIRPVDRGHVENILREVIEGNGTKG